MWADHYDASVEREMQENDAMGLTQAAYRSLPSTAQHRPPLLADFPVIPRDAPTYLAADVADDACMADRLNLRYGGYGGRLGSVRHRDHPPEEALRRKRPCVPV